MTDFSGRDRRGQFWPFAGVVIGMLTVVWILNPDLAFAGWRDHPELMPDSARSFGFMAGLFIAIALLLAAAAARRLLDSNRSGRLVLVSLTLLLSGFAIHAKAFGLLLSNEEEAALLFVLGFACMFVNIAILYVLIYLLVRKGTPGPNRFGDPPARASMIASQRRDHVFQSRRITQREDMPA